MTASVQHRPEKISTTALIRIAALCAALGVSLSITEQFASLGKWFAVAGVVLLIVGLHRYGRTGPDAPISFSDATPPKKKKKKKRKVAPRTEDDPKIEDE